MKQIFDGIRSKIKFGHIGAGNSQSGSRNKIAGRDINRRDTSFKVGGDGGDSVYGGGGGGGGLFEGGEGGSGVGAGGGGAAGPSGGRGAMEEALKRMAFLASSREVGAARRDRVEATGETALADWFS